MALTDFKFVCPLRVRWAETDPVGVVFNGHYASYIHVAFTEYLRALGWPNAIAQQQAGFVLYVRKSTIEYLGSAHFDDALEIGFRCASLGRSSLRFVQEIYCGEQLLITGELVYVYTDIALGKGVAIPEDWRASVLAFEKIAQQTS
ncbi:MAG: acyl-CoA thioesterase [Burkholderiales bacterium]|nr:acyl-CoA thioesterase [Burkholderiales bacterium]